MPTMGNEATEDGPGFLDRAVRAVLSGRRLGSVLRFIIRFLGPPHSDCGVAHTLSAARTNPIEFDHRLNRSQLQLNVPWSLHFGALPASLSLA